MASNQSMTQAITQAVIEATKPAIMPVSKSEGFSKSREPAHTVPKGSRPKLRQQTFDWKVQDKYKYI